MSDLLSDRKTDAAPTRSNFSILNIISSGESASGSSDIIKPQPTAHPKNVRSLSDDEVPIPEKRARIHEGTASPNISPRSAQEILTPEERLPQNSPPTPSTSSGGIELMTSNVIRRSWPPHSVATGSLPFYSTPLFNGASPFLHPALLASSQWSSPYLEMCKNEMLNPLLTGADLLPGYVCGFSRKPKRVRTAFSPTQLMQLEKAFDKNHYVVGAERKQLAQGLQLTETQVKVWFQNRRTKYKRTQSEEETRHRPGGGQPGSGVNSGKRACSTGPPPFTPVCDSPTSTATEH